MSKLSAEATALILVSYKADFTASELVKIFKDFGGRDVFVKTKLSAEQKFLRNAFLKSPKFPIALYDEIVTNTAKFSRADISMIAGRKHVFGSYELFKKFWAFSPDGTMLALADVAYKMTMDNLAYKALNAWERPPMIHAADCRGDEPGNLLAHYFCEQTLIFRSDFNLTIEKSVRDSMMALLDAQVLETIQDEIFNLGETSRIVYAKSHYIRSDHWAKLAEDPKRTVINELVGNALIPLSVAKELVGKHKTPALRMTLAKKTTSLELLKTIWFSTESTDIRKSVEANPLFVKTTLME